MDLTSSKLLNDVFYTSECCRCSASAAPHLWRLINCDTSLLGESTKSSSQSHPSSLCLLSLVFCVNLTALMRSLGATPPFMQPHPWGSYWLSGPIDSSSLPLGPPPSCPFMVPTWNEPLCVSPHPPPPPLPFLMIISVLHHQSPSWARLLYMQTDPVSQPNPHLSVTSASEYGRKHSGWLTRSSYGSEDFPLRG